MGKIVAFMNSFKGIFGGDKPGADTAEIERDRGDDYAVEKKSTSFYVISMIVSVLGAVLIWLFAVSTGSTEKIFSIQPEMRELPSFVSAAEQSGFTVVMEADSTVSFALEGRQKVVNEVTNNDIAVYVDLEALIGDVHKLPNNKEQILTAEIHIEAPIYFNIADVSKDKITIKLVPINKGTE